MYSVREHPDSLSEIVRRVAANGYNGVEFAHRFQWEPPDDIATVLEETGLVPVAVHADLSTIEDALAGEADLLERSATVGCDRLIVPHLDSTHFRTRESVRALADRLNDVATALDDRGLELGLHNDRSWLCPLLPGGVETLIDATPTPDGAADYIQEAGRRLRARNTGPVPRRTPIWYLIAETDPDAIWFELEVAELHVGGVAPTEAVSLLDGRVEMLHLRDVAPGPGLGEYESVPHGDGVVDMKRTLEAAGDAGVEWVIYENELNTAPEEKIDAGRRFFDRTLGEQAATTGLAHRTEAP
ncbi:sugar phosphate isomerase/epimerase [Halorubrum sp. CBA1125]|uniref:sugar phosphate isomerase/epimerase family protein n=1 Tax=Halorubrum sp. CBA1125 TaxID=2668072 RepID=UPI0018D1F9CA|nr:sugar phosphate isomerase/epimerase [Halorubrum sp. CBA1125]